jgi:hypothetical protein
MFDIMLDVLSGVAAMVAAVQECDATGADLGFGAGIIISQ